MVVHRDILPRTFVRVRPSQRRTRTKERLYVRVRRFQPCLIFCTHKSTSSLHSHELIVVFSSKRSLAHWSSYTTLMLCCVRPFGQKKIGSVQKYEYDVKVSRTRTFVRGQRRTKVRPCGHTFTLRKTPKFGL